MIAASYPFMDILWSMIIFFAWVIWIWMIIMCLTDIFGRHDIHGWGKAGWTLFVIVLPFLGVFIYLIAEGKAMAERRAGVARGQQAQFDEHVRSVASEAGPAGEIEKAKGLLDAGAITQAEFDAIKTKALA